MLAPQGFHRAALQESSPGQRTPSKTTFCCQQNEETMKSSEHCASLGETQCKKLQWQGCWMRGAVLVGCPCSVGRDRGIAQRERGLHTSGHLDRRGQTHSRFIFEFLSGTLHNGDKQKVKYNLGCTFKEVSLPRSCSGGVSLLCKKCR